MCLFLCNTYPGICFCDCFVRLNLFMIIHICLFIGLTDISGVTMYFFMKYLTISFLLVVLVIKVCSGQIGQPCAPRNYGHGSVACVCNQTYCDTINTKIPVPLNSVSVFTSTKSGQRFKFSIKSLKPIGEIGKSDELELLIDKSSKFQPIKGFGGALTDSASINIKSLSETTQEMLLQSYFGEYGIEYNMIRIPMASCDYSTRQYTYLDTKDDFNLTTFALAKEDTDYKIPLINIIKNITQRKISFYGTPWTAPAWMKTNNNEIGRGWLLGKAGDKYHKTWAKYFVKFLDEYKKAGIKFWGLTAQNEPSNGLLIKSTWQSTGFTAEMQRDFIKSDLGPALQENGYGDVKLMILDDQRIFLPSWAQVVLSDADASKYVSGIGVHWYWNSFIGPNALTDTHNFYPSKFILATEACSKTPPPEALGHWQTGVDYSNDILDNLNNWAVGWVDWNLSLNLTGGPNWANNFDDSPIIVNKTGNEFYKQPSYYHMGHFSKFILEGSYRIHVSSSKTSTLKYTAAENPDGQAVLIILNTSGNSIDAKVIDKNSYFLINIPPNSIQTYTWYPYK